jgi:hypothetical protein
LKDPADRYVEVGLWADNGTLLASTYVDAANPATLFWPISHVFLQPGNTYLIGAWGALGGCVVYFPSDPVLAAQIIPSGLAESTATAFAFPTTASSSTSTLPFANFQYQVVVPEPPVVCLMSLGFVILGLWQIWRSRARLRNP